MITVTITKKLDSFWATDEQFAEMSDSEIIDLLMEDLWEVVDKATWTIQREEK